MTKTKPTHRKHHRLHDYHSRCIYHITMVVSDRVQLLGRMVGDTVEEARVELTPLGLEIASAIQMIPIIEARKGNEVQILGAVTMPEHIHFVLFVRKPMEQKLGMIIRGFKQGCNKALREWMKKAGIGGLEKSMPPNGDRESTPSKGALSTPPPLGEAGATSQSAAALASAPSEGDRASTLPVGESGSGIDSSPLGGESFPNSPLVSAFLRHLSSCGSDRILREHALFEEDFDETRLRRQGQLRSMIDYVHNNPRHRWLKQHRPKWLCVTRGIVIAGRSYDAIGNVNLLALPRYQVHCRYRWERYHDTEARRNHQNECVLKARANYALVSPFVSPHEAVVRDFCLQEGHSVIVLHNNGFTNFSQCPGGLYDYCVEGQVLVLVPSDWPHDDRKNSCTRKECTLLNGYAEDICRE